MMGALGIVPLGRATAIWERCAKREYNWSWWVVHVKWLPHEYTVTQGFPAQHEIAMRKRISSRPQSGRSLL